MGPWSPIEWSGPEVTQQKTQPCSFQPDSSSLLTACPTGPGTLPGCVTPHGQGLGRADALLPWQSLSCSLLAPLGWVWAPVSGLVSDTGHLTCLAPGTHCPAPPPGAAGGPACGTRSSAPGGKPTARGAGGQGRSQAGRAAPSAKGMRKPEPLPLLPALPLMPWGPTLSAAWHGPKGGRAGFLGRPGCGALPGGWILAQQEHPRDAAGSPGSPRSRAGRSLPCWALPV